MKNEETVLFQLPTETDMSMMSFVIVTKNNNTIVIDGGRAEDMPLLKQCIGGRHISAWILTHAHSDHISGFVSEFRKNSAEDFDIENVYFNFPPVDIIHNHDVEDYEYYKSELLEILPEFNEIFPRFENKAHIVAQGDVIKIDEVTIEFLFSYHEGLTSNLMNDSSLVFKLSADNKSVLFLGDLGPEGGDVLYEESWHLLKADIVQMAHHGHMNCGMEIYAAIMPEVCLWCCPAALYDEEEIPEILSDRKALAERGKRRMYGTRMTRRWMDTLGVKKHYVSKDGMNRVVL